MIEVMVLSLLGGLLAGYLLGGAAYRRLVRRLRSGQPKKRVGVMDRVLIIEIVVLLVYAVADMIVFWHTGAEPTALTACIFAAAGLENGVMGWIKTNKDKLQGENEQEKEPEESEADG